MFTLCMIMTVSFNSVCPQLSTVEGSSMVMCVTHELSVQQRCTCLCSSSENTNSTQTELTTGYPSAQIHFMSDWVRQSPHSIAAVLHFRRSRCRTGWKSYLACSFHHKPPRRCGAGCWCWLMQLLTFGSGCKKNSSCPKFTEHWLEGFECLLQSLPGAKACWTCALGAVSCWMNKRVL